MAWKKLEQPRRMEKCGHESDEVYIFPKSGKEGVICKACNSKQFKEYRAARKARTAAPQVPVTGWMPA